MWIVWDVINKQRIQDALQAPAGFAGKKFINISLGFHKNFSADYIKKGGTGFRLCDGSMAIIFGKAMR